MIKKILHAAIAALLFTGTGYSIELKEKGIIETGLIPFYGMSFGEFYDQYNNPFGFSVYGRGYYEIIITKDINLFPEACIGWLYMSHKSEIGRYINFFPLYVNCIMDWSTLRLSYGWGDLTFLPYLGLGLNYVQYKSPRMDSAQLDSGYQLGIHTIYNHKSLKNFFVELGIEHFLTTEFNATLGSLKFSLGAGYKFELPKKSDKEDLEKKKAEYINDLNSNDENKIIEASIWLGRKEAGDVVPRMVELLLKDKRVRVRISAAAALGLIRAKDTLEPLTYAASRDVNSDVRYASLLSISKIGPDKKTMDALIERKKREKDALILNYIAEMEKNIK